MSSRGQNAFKNQTKLGTKSSEKSKNKIEEIKKKEQDKELLKTRITHNTKAKQSEKPKTVTKLISSKSSQSGTNSSSKSSSSNVSNRSTEIKKINKSLANKKDVTTPTSNRISKTQFFPSKELYKNAIKTVLDSSKDRERNKTRTLSPSEVKVLKSDSERSSTESFVHRPHTATITKISNIEGDDEEYDDDFESYESDFEEYMSSNTSETTSEISTSDEHESQITAEIDEEHKLDSGNFELPEVKYKQVLDNIQESTENINILAEQNRSNLTSLSDEGFEDGKTERSGQFVNFVDAQRKQKYLKSFAIKQRRGEELANMIKLDGQMFTIFEMESIPYNIFIKKFGNNNTVQSSTQTGDDNISEEIQTIQIDRVNMWTQYPVKLSEIKRNNINLNIYKQEQLGVGSDQVVTNSQELNYNEQVLIHFMDNVSDVMLSLIEETSQQKSCNDIEVNSNKIPFSEGYVSFNTRLSYLQNIPIISANFSSNTTKLITVHSDNESSILCIWKISDTNVPEYYIKTHGILTCSVLVRVYIYGGLSDGTIAIFNLKGQVTNVKDGVTAPTYLTNIEEGHISKVVSLEVINNNENLTSDDTCDFQVYSLDEDGYIIIWTVITLQNYNKSHVSLQQNIKLSLKEIYPHLLDLQCTNMAVNQLDVNHIFVSTNYGQILHFITTTGSKANPKQYTTDWISRSNCIATCPFSPLYMIVAYENGNIVLFSRNTETPLITLMNCDDITDSNGVEFVEWSINKPCILYVKDKKNCIHIWDLSMSDIFPIYTVPFKEEINFIKLSPDISRDENIKKSYMVIISDKYNVNLHILNKDHGQQNPSDYESNVKKFLNYVNRL